MFVTHYTLIVQFFLLPLLVVGQLAGRVGPTTSRAAKAAKKCNITSYGAKPGKGGDIGPALTAAFNACKTGGTIVIPPGDWGLGTWVNFNGGTGWALQWDGVIYRNGQAGGNMLLVQHANDVEFFSSTGKGAFQGNGYEFHAKNNILGPRILRFVKTNNFAVHDLAFADAPSFHFSMDTCKNGEVYNMAIRGANRGGLDGIDVWSDNIWLHDIMVTNKDECVTVKSPAHNILVENIYCNWSGGSAFGSLGENVDISNVLYRNVYTYRSNQMMMIKSNGGSGRMSNVVMENFIGYSNAYSLDIDQHWSPMKVHPGAGVKLSNITFKGWKGTAENGNNRGPIKIICSDSAPCTGIHIRDFAMWTDTGNSIFYQCQSAYGTGGCLKAGSGGGYPAVKQTITSPPASYKAPRMPWDLKQSFGTTTLIPIPEIPDHFFPGTKPIKPLARHGGGGSGGPVPAKPEPAKPVPAKPEPVKPEPAKPTPAKPEPAKPEPAKPSSGSPAAPSGSGSGKGPTSSPNTGKGPTQGSNSGKGSSLGSLLGSLFGKGPTR